MLGSRFDYWTKTLVSALPTRRALLSAIAAGAFGPLADGPGGPKETVAGGCEGPNERLPGAPCSRDEQCCFRICRRGRCRCGDGSRPCFSTPAGLACCGGTAACRDGACVDHCVSRRQDGDESDVDCGGSRCPKCAGGKTCFENRDCVSGVCVDFACADCAVDGHCPVDAPFCIDNNCVNCRGDGDCAAGTPFCIDNFCRQCHDATDCPASLPVCGQNGFCRRCRSNGECPTGRRCRDGRCRPPGGGRRPR
jgi:hypothetical protein